MTKRFYVTTRDLHLYTGLFLSPFVLAFAASVFFLVHAPSTVTATVEDSRFASDLHFSPEIERLNARDQVIALRPVLAQIGVHGEVNFIRRIPKEHRLIVPVLLPGRETTVELDVLRRSARISVRPKGLSDAIVHLHKMPGPHNVSIRGNAGYMVAWRWLADVTSYGLLFLTASGVYLWAVLRAERRIGLALVCTGAISFFGLIYALAR